MLPVFSQPKFDSIQLFALEAKDSDTTLFLAMTRRIYFAGGKGKRQALVLVGARTLLMTFKVFYLFIRYTLFGRRYTLDI